MNNKVKSLMVLNGIKQVDIAKQLHVSPVSVSLVIAGKRSSSRIKTVIAKMLKMRVEKLWSKVA